MTIVSSAQPTTGQTPGQSAPIQLTVVRRDGSTTTFDPTKISVALSKAFLAVEGTEAGSSHRVRDLVADLTARVVAALTSRGDARRSVQVEDIQDQVELALMRAGEHQVARAYVLYREERSRARTPENAAELSTQPPAITVRAADGSTAPLDVERLRLIVAEAAAGLDSVDAELILNETLGSCYDGIAQHEVELALVMAARAYVETEPEYSFAASRLLLDQIRREALGRVHGEPRQASQADMASAYVDYFPKYIATGIEAGLLDPELATFDLAKVAAAIQPERDLDFAFLGLQTLYDRYLLHIDKVRFELPQAFFLRVAMGIALKEENREDRAIELYELLSSFRFMSSTPTLFNSGTTRPQLSSCFLTTVEDDLAGIFSGIRNNALLAKYSGGLGNDWTPVRGIGAKIRGTNGESQGVVPFLKIANDTAVAVNQGGKRKGAVCAYLETWHIDVEEFLDLRKNTGDERRRTHDMNTANWVPDLFLQRVEAGGDWTLFSPNEVPDLHDLYGAAFAEAYVGYEKAADRGEIRVFKRVKAVDLWRRMLTVLFETGHPWITFKDACNLRSPQQHDGVVHSSNLCTEITLNTTVDETAVCNLGSVNLVAHLTATGLDADLLRDTVKTAVRMLDNVIDVNFYTTPESERANQRHRPVGLGLMGFADALFSLRIPYSSDAAVAFADSSMEQISYHAIEASSDLAAERGSYQTYDGSLWSQGILPIDSLELLREARNGDLTVDTSRTLDWDALRAKVQRDGMRNSNVLAIAPTATISNICGVSQSIEPIYRNLFVKSNMSGEFTVANPYLVADLKARGLWDQVMVSDLKYHDGILSQIDRVPADLQELYATAFELDPLWLVKAASRRQKWLDKAQSLNLYMSAPSGKALDELYRSAWRHGLKTTYYLRSQSATHVEKSTLQGTDGRLNAVPVALPEPTAPATLSAALPEPTGAVCSIDDPDCEACQ
ncbi:ribonucleoside-diphosphate reductase alpha chain [Kribbella orskensis]|uniref:Ribonucleoside-diphosphate reductase n=1 Tax=Kribbella orskensis TaxID=2512216 RepID=A0ABY2BIJ0_9ACTN|nr:MULTISPECIES: ribonucleoside-diphosphate reductase subunit alpha [Kribbella]TCN37486.1 ribonucleoside-diphosphate reductase alpha chain [Kribbella sp. VKM Ac-2500]TCO19012.1 ribonucleoside-diphosphate reductase alpha chain [Kribbella orskensis]